MEIQSQEIDKIIEALAKAQGNIEVAVYDSKNPHYKSDYASYEAVRKACLKPLSDNGLAITHILTVIDTKRVMVTQLSHTSGQWLRTYLCLPQDKETPQGVGASITYAKRYSLGALLAIACDEDDDAETIEKPYKESAPEPFTGEPGDFVMKGGKYANKKISEVPDSYFQYLKEKGLLNNPEAQPLLNALKASGRYETL